MACCKEFETCCTIDFDLDILGKLSAALGEKGFWQIFVACHEFTVYSGKVSSK